jgi:hypothetical protein
MTLRVHDGPRLWEPVWQLQQRRLEVRGAEYRLRLVRFEAGWLASVDTESGPTLGMDRSPYLAARRALEPIGVGMVEAMTLLGRIRTG